MGATMESVPTRAQGLRSSALKRPISIQQHGCRIVVDPDMSVRQFHSLLERRALFGFEQVFLYKIQAGIVVPSQRPDWSLRPSPRSVQAAGKVFDWVEVAQSVEFARSRSPGYIRRLKLKNGPVGISR